MKKTADETRTANDGSKKFQRIKRLVSSLVIAIIVWFVIVNVVNPKITVSITDVPVRFVGESSLRDRGFVVVDKDELPQFSVKVRGTRSDLISAMQRVRVDIDLSGISDVGKITVVPTVSLPDYISLEKQKFTSVEIDVEPGYEKDVPVKIMQTGDEKKKSEGKIVRSVPEYKTVTVMGSKSDIEMVSAFVADVNVADISYDATTVYVIHPVDKEGNPLDLEVSVYYSGTVAVTNTVLARHTVPVEISADEQLKKKFLITYDERQIKRTALDVGVEEGARVPDRIIAVVKDGEYKAGENTVEMKYKASEGIYLSESTLTATLNFEKLNLKTVPVTIELKDLSDKLKSDHMKFTQDMELYVPESVTDEIWAYVDCSKYGAGEHSAPIKFYNENITAEKNPSVRIVLKLKEEK